MGLRVTSSSSVWYNLTNGLLHKNKASTDLLKIKDFSFGKYWLDVHLSTVSEVSSPIGKLTLAVAASAIYAVAFWIAGSVVSRKRQL